MGTVTAMDASTFAAIGEPSRLRIVELLRTGPRSVGDIVEALGIRQPQVSKHLRVLGESRIVAVRPLARRRIYHLEAEPFDAIGHWVDSFERVWETRLDSLGEPLDSMNTASVNTTSMKTTSMNTGRTDDGEQERR
jgi:DNA-binding transcriptional ArsR family regulator